MRASREALAVIAMVTPVLIGIVVGGISVIDRGDPPPAPIETPTDDAAL